MKAVRKWEGNEVLKLLFDSAQKKETWISDKPLFAYAVLLDFLKRKGSSGGEIIHICDFKRTFFDFPWKGCEWKYKNVIANWDAFARDLRRHWTCQTSFNYRQDECRLGGILWIKKWPEITEQDIQLFPKRFFPKKCLGPRQGYL